MRNAGGPIHLFFHLFIFFRLSIKENLFPVHRVGEIEASRAAAIFLFHFFLVGKFCPFFGIFFFC